MSAAGQMILQSILSGFQQPSATLNQTNAAAGAAGASAANTSQNTAINAQKLEQQQYIADAQKSLDASKNKQGYVNPQLFNTLKDGFSKISGDESAFDSKFTQYTDPNNIDYNTPDARTRLQQYQITKSQIQKNLDQFNAIPKDQKGVFSLKAYEAYIPLIKQLTAPQAASYEDTKGGFAANLAPTLGGGQGSGLRINLPELQQWQKYLPSVQNATTYNSSNISKLNDALVSKFGGHGLDSHYLPSQGRTPISAFGQ